MSRYKIDITDPSPYLEKTLYPQTPKKQPLRVSVQKVRSLASKNSKRFRHNINSTQISTILVISTSIILRAISSVLAEAI